MRMAQRRAVQGLCIVGFSALLGLVHGYSDWPLSISTAMAEPSDRGGDRGHGGGRDDRDARGGGHEGRGQGGHGDHDKRGDDLGGISDDLSDLGRDIEDRAHDLADRAGDVGGGFGSAEARDDDRGRDDRSANDNGKGNDGGPSGGTDNGSGDKGDKGDKGAGDPGGGGGSTGTDGSGSGGAGGSAGAPSEPDTPTSGPGPDSAGPGSGGSSSDPAPDTATASVDRGDPGDLARAARGTVERVPDRERTDDGSRDRISPTSLPRIISWQSVAAPPVGKRVDWTWLDSPIRGEPHAPSKLRELSGNEEKDLLTREWR